MSGKGCKYCKVAKPCLAFQYRGSGCAALRAEVGVFSDPDKDVPVTNADRIRAMTDEELARHLLAEADLCKFCNTDRFCVGYPTGNDKRCVEAVIKWLQQPCEDSPTGQKG